jgi:hypothetical protein
MVLREEQGGLAALDALVCCELQQDVSLLNGGSGIAPPPGGYVWDRESAAAAAFKQR